MWKNYFKKNTPVIPAAWQQHPLPHITRRHCLIRHWLFAAKFMSSFRVPNRVLQAVPTNYWELAQEVKPVCLLCSGDPLRPEHRLCVGVVGNERLASMPPRTRRWRTSVLQTHHWVCAHRLGRWWRASRVRVIVDYASRLLLLERWLGALWNIGWTG